MASNSEYKPEKTCPPLAGIIVSADDFGQSPAANKNILSLIAQKKLQRISVMIDGKLSPEEIRLLLDSQINLDLHLDLSGLVENNPDLRKKTGIFGRLMIFLKNYSSGKTGIANTSKDWSRQIEKFRVIFGRYPSGLNSHEHIHLFPPYFKLILILAKKSRIAYLRFGKKDFVRMNNAVSLIIFFLKKINRRDFLASGLASSDFLGSLDWLKNNYLKKTKSLPVGEIELIIHPERMDEWEFLKNSGFNFLV